MDKKDIEFQKRIQATFRIEAEEHLHAISAGLIELEKSKSRKKIADTIEVMFREVHSLKGAARSVDQKDIEYMCQPMESIFSALKRREIVLSPLSFDLFYKTVEWLSKHVATSGTEQSVVSRQIQRDLIRQLKEMVSGKAFAAVMQEPSAADTKQLHPAQSESISETESVEDLSGKSMPAQIEMVRIPISKLDSLLLQAEEMILAKIAVDQRSSELRGLCNELNEWKTEAQKWRSRRTSAT
ncbi:MAG: Hpt domain-containing protein, partial [Bacteroidia bacterium]|nr:Hpt domain-containing protein [Bacteroidia bacterium]